jgi:hypothetical protein
MLLNYLLAAGALAVQTSAFLVPLEVAQEAAKNNKELKHQTVELDCPSCPFAGPEGDGSVWTQQEDAPNSIVRWFGLYD